MNTHAIAAAAVVLSALTACGSTQLAAQPVLTTQGVVPTTPGSFTIPFGPLASPCTGEILNGFTTFSNVRKEVTDANGGTHLQVTLTYTSTHTGDRGTTFTESGKGHRHVNMPSSGAVNSVEVFNSLIIGSDGTTIVAKERFAFVMDKGGIVRVERNNLETNAYRCKRG